MKENYLDTLSKKEKDQLFYGVKLMAEASVGRMLDRQKSEDEFRENIRLRETRGK